MRNDKSRERILVTRGAGFNGSQLIRLLDTEEEVLCAEDCFTGTRCNIGEYPDHPCFELIRHNVTFPLYVEVVQVDSLAVPASPVHSSSTASRPPDQRARCGQHAGSSQAPQGVHLSVKHVGVVRRSDRAPTDRGQLGQGQLHRAAQVLLRGQTLRRDAFRRLAPPAPARHPRGADLQHLWVANAPERWQGD